MEGGGGGEGGGDGGDGGGTLDWRVSLVALGGLLAGLGISQLADSVIDVGLLAEVLIVVVPAFVAGLVASVYFQGWNNTANGFVLIGILGLIGWLATLC